MGRKVFTQFDAREYVEAGYCDNHTVNALTGLLMDLANALPRLSPAERSASQLYLEGLDHSPQLVPDQPWYDRWSQEALALLQQHTDEGLTWVRSADGSLALEEDE